MHSSLLRPGMLVKLRTDSKERNSMVQAYKVNDLIRFNKALNEPDKFVSISNTHILGLVLPSLNVTLSYLESGRIGLYLGFIHVEDYGKFLLHHGILLDNSVYLVQDETFVVFC